MEKLAYKFSNYPEYNEPVLKSYSPRVPLVRDVETPEMLKYNRVSAGVVPSVTNNGEIVFNSGLAKFVAVRVPPNDIGKFVPKFFQPEMEARNALCKASFQALSALGDEGKLREIEARLLTSYAKQQNVSHNVSETFVSRLGSMKIEYLDAIQQMIAYMGDYDLTHEMGWAFKISRPVSKYKDHYYVRMEDNVSGAPVIWAVISLATDVNINNPKKNQGCMVLHGWTRSLLGIYANANGVGGEGGDGPFFLSFLTEIGSALLKFPITKIYLEALEGTERTVQNLRNQKVLIPLIDLTKKTLKSDSTDLNYKAGSPDKIIVHETLRNYWKTVTPQSDSAAAAAAAKAASAAEAPFKKLRGVPSYGAVFSVFNPRRVEDSKKCCAMSLFRPRVRNDKHAVYHDSLLKFVARFANVFGPTWFIRLYIDDSLVSSNYVYKPGLKVIQDGVMNVNGAEAVYWTKLIEQLKQVEYVEIIKVDWPFAKDKDDNAHHIRYAGMLFRHHALWDTSLTACIVRDVDAACIEPDFLSIEYWLQNRKEQGMHVFAADYNPTHIFAATIAKYRRSDIKHTIAGAMFGARPSMIKGSWKTSVEDHCFKYVTEIEPEYSNYPSFSYGFDEFILNVYVLVLSQSNVFQQPVFDFYEPNTGNNPGADNLYPHMSARHLELFYRHCKRVEDSSYDIRLGLGIKEDDDVKNVDSNTMHTGYITGMMYRFLQRHTESDPLFEECPLLKNYDLPRGTILFWDHMLGADYPILSYGTIVVQTYDENTGVFGEKYTVKNVGVVKEKNLWQVLQEKTRIIFYNLSIAPNKDQESFVDTNRHWHYIHTQSMLLPAGVTLYAPYYGEQMSTERCVGCGINQSTVQCGRGDLCKAPGAAAMYCGQECADRHWPQHECSGGRESTE
jgi:hypothetical protein